MQIVLPPGHEQIRAAVAAVQAEYPWRFVGGEPTLTFKPGAGGAVVVEPVDGGATITYGSVAEGLRGLGLAMGDVLDQRSVRRREESTPFRSIAVMLDVSRNAVLTVAAATGMMRRLALMGYTQVLLYTEDMYEIPGEPYFGHARGRYSTAELRAIDDAAAEVGLELVPCIQTLGHLANVVKWRPYVPIRDNSEVLLVDEPATYDFVRKMIVAATGAVRSRRVHIGLDETRGIGGGAHRNRFGVQPPFEIFTRHVHRVAAICAELGLEPMMWSDMYLKFASAEHEMHDLDAPFPSGEVVPDGMGLVHWDYLHVDGEHYARQFHRHQSAGHNPVYAAGALTWGRLWAQNTSSIAAFTPGLAAARGTGVADVMLTTWGNDGSQCDLYAALPAMQAFADLAYDESAGSDLSAHFRGSCDGTVATWLRADDIDLPLRVGAHGADHAELFGNPGAWLLWMDPVLDLVEVPAEPLAERYAAIARDLHGAAGPDAIVEIVRLLARVLEVKVSLHQRLRPAYQNRHAETVRAILDQDLPLLEERIRELRLHHRDQWFGHYKSFGWEVIDLRYGGLLARLDTLRAMLGAWLADPVGTLEAFEVDQLPIGGIGPAGQMLWHSQVASASPVN